MEPQHTSFTIACPRCGEDVFGEDTETYNVHVQPWDPEDPDGGFEIVRDEQTGHVEFLRYVCTGCNATWDADEPLLDEWAQKTAT